LFLANQGLVFFVVNHLLRVSPAVRRLGKDDAVQEAGLALLGAASLFDESRGVSFGTYAVASIRRHVLMAAHRFALVRVADHAARRGEHVTTVPLDDERTGAPACRDVLGDILGDAIDRLDWLDAYVLNRTLAGHSEASTGRVLRCSRQWIHHIKRRAIVRLKRILEA
jgi:RNA polymerase sigma factor (sigma-70 family)